MSVISFKGRTNNSKRCDSSTHQVEDVTNQPLNPLNAFRFVSNIHQGI